MSAVTASVIMLRGTSPRLEVFWVERSPKASFLSGFRAFPGGHLEPGDGEGDQGLRAAALRELMEETGVSLQGDLLEPAGLWTTPPYLVVRMTSHFFTARVGHDVEPVVTEAQSGGELTSGEWIRPEDALSRWSESRVLLAPPTLFILRALQRGADVDSSLFTEIPETRGEASRFALIRPHITLFPVRTPTLPPATHTNVYVYGTDTLAVIDPASPYEDERVALIEHLEARVKGGSTLSAILLTHGHHDHIGGAAHLAAHFGCPIWAHADLEHSLPFPVARVLHDGLVLKFGDHALRCLYTPGHAPGHLVYWDEATDTAIVGDLVAGVGTILVDPDEGSMALYLDSLRRIRARGASALLPSHGGVIGGAESKLTDYIRHREWREKKVLETLGPSPIPQAMLLERVYDDVAPWLWPIALMSLRAHLYKLRDEGLVFEGRDESETTWRSEVTVSSTP
ncbi:MAG: MBL fold metallo-hydrolase [Myxococcales bacterium]|nr:MBL fold metallo-hydrolase [Myxococcales bacterium]